MKLEFAPLQSAWMERYNDIQLATCIGWWLHMNFFLRWAGLDRKQTNPIWSPFLGREIKISPPGENPPWVRKVGHELSPVTTQSSDHPLGHAESLLDKCRSIQTLCRDKGVGSSTVTLGYSTKHRNLDVNLIFGSTASWIHYYAFRQGG